MLKDNIWNTALDIAHIEGKFEASGDEMPLYLQKRLDTLYQALYVLTKEEKVKRTLTALETLLYDELIGNGKSNNVVIYANAVALLDSLKEYDVSVDDILHDARVEVKRRFSHRHNDA